MKSFTENSKTLNPRLWLSEEFTKRRSKNQNYSLRAFSNLLSLDPSTVSQVLSGKRPVTKKMLTHLIEILGTDPQTKQGLLNFSEKKVSKELENNYRQLTMDAFSLISEWYHYAILEFTFVQDFKNDHRWIARMLGITTTDVSLAIDRLKRLELIEEVDGRLMKTEVFITNFKDGVTSTALKNLQRSIISMALDAIDNTPQDEKDITSMTFAIDVEKLPEAKEKIKVFRREMSLLLETGKQTRVYHLGVQLYPISKKTKENSK
jgi:uncharacterized protein (TIGR02147 family)